MWLFEFLFNSTLSCLCLIVFSWYLSVNQPTYFPDKFEKKHDNKIRKIDGLLWDDTTHEELLACIVTRCKIVGDIINKKWIKKNQKSKLDVLLDFVID